MEQQSACTMRVPTLETERLRLREHRTSDLPAMIAMWSDPEVTRFLNTSPLTPEDCWGRFLRYRGHWCTLGYGYWAMEERSTGAFLGEAGFANYQRQTEPQADTSPEAGWVLARPYHGKGYATEIIEAILVWGREHFGTVPLRCIIHPDHAASLRVAAKAGFVVKKTLTYKASPTVLLELSGQQTSSA